ncbi:MAG: TlpA family protein disulfide reductase [Rhodopirellula sp.]|nr:TlpA family protein disulfide reductase [Rhodopirellula sp.]
MSTPTPSDTVRPATRRAGCFAAMIAALAAALVLLMLLLAVVLYGYLPKIRELREKQGGVGKPLSALQLHPLTGAAEPVTLAELHGKVVLVNFWGTWCPPCRAEIPHLAKLRTKLIDRSDFRLLAVSCGEGGPEDLVELEAATQAYLEHARIDLPTYADPERTTRGAFDHAAGLNGFPTTFLLDREGVIRAVWEGYAPGLVDTMEARVLELLRE